MQRMGRHRVLPKWLGWFLIFPSTDLVVCPACHGVARNESVLDRAMSAIFLLPFLLGSLAAMGTGLYVLGAMLANGHVSATWAGIGLGLVAAGGYAGYRAGRGLRRLVSPRKMLPIAGWTGTDL